MAGGWGASGTGVVAGGTGCAGRSGTADPVAVAALVVALVGLVVPPLLLVGAGLGIAGLVRSAGRHGWGLAGAAVAVGGTASAMAVTVGVVLATAPFSPWQPLRLLAGDESAPAAAAAGGPATSAPPVADSPGTGEPADAADDPSPTTSPSVPATATDDDRWTVAVDELVPGDCVEELVEPGEIDEVTVITCREPHAYEIFSAFPVEEDLWPGDAGVEEIAIVGCGERLDDALARYGVAGDDLDLWVLYPTKSSWDWGDRSVTCAIYDYEDGILDPGHLISGTAVPLSMADG